jgi:hypothetical protein
MMKQWWEDDLPNILGINPLEAAVIFGALYYFYGPTILYEYAREAGRLVSTYSPIVRDVSLNIFNEFIDFSNHLWIILLPKNIIFPAVICKQYIHL